MVSLKAGLDKVSGMKISPLAGSRNQVASHYPVTLLAELSLLLYVVVYAHSIFEEEQTKTTLHYTFTTDTNVAPFTTHAHCHTIFFQACACDPNPIQNNTFPHVTNTGESRR
jgi:hypothetical protein